MIDEARLREILHDIVGEVVGHLFVRDIHDQYRVRDMVERVHIKIDTLTDE